MKFRHSFILLFFILFCFSCKTAPDNVSVPPQPTAQEEQEQSGSVPHAAESNSGGTEQTAPITLLFGGDIMAHQENFTMKEFSRIWENVSPLIQSADLSFANIEAPVNDTIPFETYPTFNMKSSYSEAAITAGFNVFSLANNHCNDKGLSGILATVHWKEQTEKQTARNSRPVYFSGLNDAANKTISYTIIEKNGWTVIFCALTELLNQPAGASYVNYVPPKETLRKQFCRTVRSIRNAHPCDLFIISIHCAEPEYVHIVSARQRAYYHQLLDSGADVVWANHPHVVKEREIVGRKADGKITKLIMYANGNTISGQRRNPQFSNPLNERENTGDGLLLLVTYMKSGNKPPEITDVTPYYITTYITTAHEFVLRYLDTPFISYLTSINRTEWAAYLSKRKAIMTNIKEIKTWL